MPRLAAVGAFLLIALTACGGSSTSSSPPTNASTQAFCTTFRGLQGRTPSEAADALARIGTPASATGANRKGLVLLIRQLRTLPSSDMHVRLSTIENDLSGERRHLVGGFVFYVENTCLAQQ